MTTAYSSPAALTWEEVHRNLRREIQRSIDLDDDSSYVVGLEVADDIHASVTAKTKNPHRRKRMFLCELRLIQESYEDMLAREHDMYDDRFEFLAAIDHAIVHGEAHRPQVDPYRLRDRLIIKTAAITTIAGAVVATAVVARKRR